MENVKTEEDKLSVLGIVRYISDMVDNEKSAKFLESIDLERQDLKVILEYLEEKSIFDPNDTQYNYKESMHKKNLIRIIVQVMKNTDNDTFNPQISPRWLRVLPSMNMQSVTSFVKFQLSFDDAQQTFSNWYQNSIKMFQNDMNEKFKQLNDMMLNNMNGIVATTKNVACTNKSETRENSNQ